MENVAGGDIILKGGESSGLSRNARGGKIQLLGGFTQLGQGGSIEIKSGSGHNARSGDVVILTEMNKEQASGEIFLATGDAVNIENPSNSGSITLKTGISEWNGGNINLESGIGSGGSGAKLKMKGGAHYNRRYSWSRETSGGDIELSGGSASKDSVKGGSVWIKGGKGGASASSGNIFLKAFTNDSDLNNSGNSRHSGEIAFALAKVDKGPFDADDSYSFRLKATSSGNTVISSVPIQVTHVQYSSDMRIKKEITQVDTDDLLERMNKVELKEYGYSYDWQKVRGIPDQRVRGIIAQQLQSIFPEHVTRFDEYNLEDKNFTIRDFLQVDKQGLVMDLIGAFQAQSKRFSIEKDTYSERVDINISTDDAGVSDYRHPEVSSGAMNIRTGASPYGSSGSLSISSGDAESGVSGNVTIKSGSTTKYQSGIIQILTQNSTNNKAGDVIIQGGSSSNISPTGSDILVKGGDGGSKAGSVKIGSGASPLSSGEISLIIPDENISFGGNITLFSGKGTAHGGSILLSSGSSEKAPGEISLKAGNSKDNYGGT